MRTNHKWSGWSSRGHGCGDGTPSGVRSVRRCEICGAKEWHDSAVSTCSGKTKTAHGYISPDGEKQSKRPKCETPA